MELKSDMRSLISVAYYSRRLVQVVYTLLVHIDSTKEIRGQLCNCSHNNETVGSYQPFLTYEERLKECGLTTLETRRLRGGQIEVFKILNGYENIDSNIFFEIKESKITRGHNYTLVKKQSRLDVRKFSFSQRTINIWNNLSTDCVHASSVNMFKNKIDKYLVKAGYT